MKFYMPTRLYIDNKAVRDHGAELAALGSRAFIVTGGSSAKNGSLSDVKNALETQGVKYDIFDETEANPSVEQIMIMRDRNRVKKKRITVQKYSLLNVKYKIVYI